MTAAIETMRTNGFDSVRLVHGFLTPRRTSQDHWSGKVFMPRKYFVNITLESLLVCDKKVLY